MKLTTIALATTLAMAGSVAFAQGGGGGGGGGAGGGSAGGAGGGSAGSSAGMTGGTGGTSMGSGSATGSSTTGTASDRTRRVSRRQTDPRTLNQGQVADRASPMCRPSPAQTSPNRPSQDSNEKGPAHRGLLRARRQNNA
jgi:ELAV like protein 2/3/4